MDKKLCSTPNDASPRPLQETTSAQPRHERMAPPRRMKAIVAGSLLILYSFYLFSQLGSPTFHPFPCITLTNRHVSAPSTAKARVPLEAHIMSKCPDTRDALRQLILPAMQKVHDKVDFTLSYIGHPAVNDGVDCKHGPSECLGNILELCARELYPDPKLSLGFVMCLTKDYRHIPERTLVEDCALEHALDFDALNECATRDDGAHGMKMLRDSVQRTKDANVTKSCTIRLNNEIYCIRDDGEWTDCSHGSGVNDLAIQVEKLYRQL